MAEDPGFKLVLMMTKAQAWVLLRWSKLFLIRLATVSSVSSQGWSFYLRQFWATAWMMDLDFNLHWMIF